MDAFGADLVEVEDSIEGCHEWVGDGHDHVDQTIALVGAAKQKHDADHQQRHQYAEDEADNALGVI